MLVSCATNKEPPRPSPALTHTPPGQCTCTQFDPEWREFVRLQDALDRSTAWETGRINCVPWNVEPTTVNENVMYWADENSMGSRYEVARVSTRFVYYAEAAATLPPPLVDWEDALSVHSVYTDLQRKNALIIRILLISHVPGWPIANLLNHRAQDIHPCFTWIDVHDLWFSAWSVDVRFDFNRRCEHFTDAPATFRARHPVSLEIGWEDKDTRKRLPFWAELTLLPRSDN